MSRSETHFARIKSTLKDVVANLRSEGIQERHLTFGGEGPVPTRKPTVPTDARSEFLANRAMGDWAERMLAQALVAAVPQWKIVQYGSTDRIAAGHPDFRAFYLAGLEDTRQFGKRPDLLVYSGSAGVEPDLSGRGYIECEAAAKKAIAAIEVRSSKFEALTYMATRKRQRESGKASSRETPSFTVKVEDLVIVYRWLERCRVPETYCQVFFDSIFAINFLDIFGIIATGAGFAIEKPEKSQEKATIMIPITSGMQVARATAMPTFAAEHRITQLGRHDAYVVPQGGGFELNATAMKKILLVKN